MSDILTSHAARWNVNGRGVCVCGWMAFVIVVVAIGGVAVVVELETQEVESASRCALARSRRRGLRCAGHVVGGLAASVVRADDWSVGSACIG